jgi:hypothetical protein
MIGQRAPSDMLRYFDTDDEGGLELIEVELADSPDGWINLPPGPHYPDATWLVVLYKRGVRKIAVRHEERVTEFDLKAIILRDGELTGVDR